MEVKNPLFHDDPTPATPSMRKEQEEKAEEEEGHDEQEKWEAAERNLPGRLTANVDPLRKLNEKKDSLDL